MLYFSVYKVQLALNVELKKYITCFAAICVFGVSTFLVMENGMRSWNSHGKVIKFHSSFSV